LRSARADYFEVLDVPLMAGRGLTTVDARCRRGALMQPTRVAARIQGQVERFSGKLSRGLVKVAPRMVHEVV
jgi:hypothetical protein